MPPEKNQRSRASLVSTELHCLHTHGMNFKVDDFFVQKSNKTSSTTEELSLHVLKVILHIYRIRPNKKISVFWVMGLKIVGRVGTLLLKKFCKQI